MEKLDINVTKSNIIIHGLNKNIKTLYNTPDVNFKYISLPIKYNIIIHLLFPVTLNITEPKLDSENKIKIN